MKTGIGTVLFVLAITFGCKEKTQQESYNKDEQIQNDTSDHQGVIIDSINNYSDHTSSNTPDTVQIDSITQNSSVTEELESTIEEKQELPDDANKTASAEILEEIYEENENPVEQKNTNLLPDHTAWDMLMIKFVTKDGAVNYRGLQKEKKTIETYINQLSNLTPTAQWSHNVRLAYWINLYNAATVNLILDHYPIKSIMEVNDGKAWDFPLLEIQGDSFTLNDIEHNIIRKRFDEPRIHFAVNCAARSCPKLLNAAYQPETLQNQLKAQSEYFLSNETKNAILADEPKLSRIFEWYASDFGDINVFIQKYIPSATLSNDYQYLEYDWSLNN